MHDVYIYEGKGQDFDGLGLVGALMPSACTHDETAGGNSEVTLEHPFDEYGKWSFLQKGRILKCWVPVRETPLLKMEPEETTTTTQTITHRVYKVSTNGGRLRLRKKPNTSAKILARYNPGTQVVKLADAGTSNGHKWYKVSIVKTGNVGYMAETYLQYVRSYTETIESESGGSSGTTEIADEAGEANWTVRPQLFEIYRKEVSDEGVVVHARHISYKLLKNITTYAPSGAVTLQTALNGILDGCMAEHDFKAYTNITGTREGIAWTRINPIKAMLDEEEGAAAKWNAQLVRDNWDLFFLKRAGRRRGMKIEYGKNLVGVDYSEDISDVATRIIPVGQKKDGTDLLLPEKYIDSAHINDYNEPMLYVLECSDCKVGKDLTTSKAYEKMRSAVNEALANGCDAPTVSLNVDFLSLGDSAEYAQYREMDKLFLYDEVEIVTQRGYADVKAQVTSLSWDCLNDRALEIGVGSVEASLSSSRLTSWQIPSGINGSKLSYGTIGSAQLGGDVVSARHVQADSIGTDALQAKSVTAEKIAAGSVTADAIQAGSISTDKLAAGSVTAEKLQAGSVTTEKLDAGAVTAEKLQAGSVTTEKLDAGAVTANKLSAGSVTAEKLDAGAVTADKIRASAVTSEKIKAGAVKADHIDAGSVTAEKIQAGSITADRLKAYIITADSGLIANGAIGTAQIADSSITSAKVVSLSADVITAGTLSAERLVIVGEDGVIYRINASSAGLSASELSKDQYKNYLNGTVIVANSITAAQIAAKTITGNEIAANAIKAANIDVVELFASEATIAQINAMDISGNEYLKLAVSSAVNSMDIGGRNLLTKTREFTPTSAAGTKIDDTYRDLAVRYLDCTALESGYQDLAQWSNVVYPEYGERYALSFYAKGSGDIETYFNGGTGYVKVKIIADSIEIRPSGDAALYVDSAGNATIGALTVDTDGNATLAADEDGNERLTVDAAGNATLAAGAGGSAAQTEDADESATSDTETYGDGKCAFELSENWTRYWVVYECASTGTRTVGKHVVFRVNHGDKAYVCGAKLEKGSVATDWSPAPEDAESEISSLKTRVSAAELKITPTAIAATVKENIEFGGRNLYKGTKDFSGNVWYNKTGWTEDGAYNGCTAMKHAEAWMGLCQDCAAEVGEYTLSAWVKCSVASTVNAYFVPGSTSGGSATVSQEYVTIPDVGTQWKRISATFNVTAAGNLRPRFELTAGSKTLWVCGLKLEKGNVATDWSPAPEDAESEISSLKTRVSAAELKITPTAIVSTVTSSESYQTLSSTASTAKSTAETAKTNAATAQSTANSAKSKAETNESDIAALDTRVSQAELKITPTAIAATVKENIEFGGRNLYKGTKDFSGNVWYNKTGWTEDGAYNGCTAMKHAEAWMGLCQDCAAEVGEYTLSAWAKCSVASTVNAYFVPGSTSGGSATVSQEYVTIPDVGTQWKRISATFNVTAAGNLRARFELTAGSKTLWICGLKLEKGNVATDWSPAPEDAADSVYVDSSYSKVEINKDRVRIVSTQMEVAVPSADGEDDVMRVDKDGVHAEVVETDMVLSDSVVSTQGAASYTPADAGALAEILEELSGKYLTGVLSIDCQNVTSGAFEVENVRGPGRIGLQNGTMNGLKITSCDCGIYCSGTTFSTAGTGVMIENSERVHFSSCVFNAGVGVQLGNNWRSRARMTACTGTCTVLAKLMLCSELDIAGSSKPTGTLDLQSGSQVYNATSDPNFTAPSSGSVPTTQVATVSLSPTSTSTSGHSGLGSKLYQGRYSSSQSFRKGVMLFTLPSDLTSAANIESATLTIKRIAGVGGGGSVVAQIRCYDQTGTLYASKSVQNGQTVSIDVTSAVKAMKTNSYTGLMLYNPDTTTVGSKSYTTGYARFAGKGESGAPVLKVTYRK